MATPSRYQNDDTLSANSRLGTAQAVKRIRDALQAGIISTFTIELKEKERLDTLAHKYYGDGRLWWILAAASDIGWGLQCPPGTRINVPSDIGNILRLI